MSCAVNRICRVLILTAAVPVLAVFAQCSRNANTVRLSDAAERGRTVFATFCFPCHNPKDPHRPGQLGPPVARSSAELLEAKVLRGTYPPGYQPKQEGAQMVPLPHVQSQLGDIAAFLAEVPAGA
jgi:mono/diheme cytochrome c family protein